MTLHLKVLVTGAAGALGHHLTTGLHGRGHAVTGFDRRPGRHEAPHVVADLLDVEALRRAAAGCDVILHVAAVPERQAFAEQLVPNNIVGTHNVLEAARLEQVRRVVYSSSVRVVSGIDWEQGTIRLDAGFVPTDHYGVSKVTCEVLGEMYARRFGMDVVSARLGWFVRNGDEAALLPTIKLGRRIYLSHRDAEDFFVRAAEANTSGYTVVFVTSRNDGDSAFDPEPARRHFGFEPRDTFPEGSSWPDDVRFDSPLVGPSLLPDRKE